MKENHTKENTSVQSRTNGKTIGGVFMVWLGASFLLREMNAFNPSLWWLVYTLGLAVIFLIGAVAQYQRYGYDRETQKAFLFGLIFLAPGLIRLTGLYTIWPVILILVGGFLVLGRKN